ncbi:hypothetical protein NDU88_002725 [Pleurodeles waltl]|uniref:Uncharacterized protein n=1 Tax=Pleurodeles waltl TaxID=8319 RepID=A0AAV7RE88_PLEWA|nr:hypothetical protein NDU88_002725 [Pleurodeles waltl]
MGKYKGAKAAQTNKIDQYTVPNPSLQEPTQKEQTHQGPATQALATAEKQAAIQEIRLALESKMVTIAINVNHLHLDLHKVAERVIGVEYDITTLQQEIKTLQATVVDQRGSEMQMEGHLEDTKGPLIGFSQRVEGPLTERLDCKYS